MEGGQNKILECSSTKLGTICKLTGTVFVWLQRTLDFLSNCISIKPAQLLALAVPMAILAWSTATFLYTSKCSFFLAKVNIHCLRGRYYCPGLEMALMIATLTSTLLWWPSCRWKNAPLKLQFLASLAFGVIIGAQYMTCNKSRK